MMFDEMLSMVVTYWIKIRFYEERMPTRCNHEEHDETNPMQATTSHRQSESKFVDKAWLKRRFFHLATLGRHKVRRRTYYVVPNVYSSSTCPDIYAFMRYICVLLVLASNCSDAPNSFVEHNRGQTSLFCQA